MIDNPLIILLIDFVNFFLDCSFFIFLPNLKEFNNCKSIIKMLLVK